MQSKRLRQSVCSGLLIASLVAPMGPGTVLALFDPGSAKDMTSVRAGSADRTRFQRRHIENELESVQSDTLGDEGQTTGEAYRAKQLESQRRRTEEETTSRNYRQRAFKTLQRVERKTQQELERRNVRLSTGGTRDQLLRRDQRVDRENALEEEARQQAERPVDESQPAVDPCATFTRQRLTRCLADQKKASIRE